MKFFSLFSSKSKHAPVALRERRAYKRVGRDPYVDWACIFIFSSIMAAALAILAFRTSHEVNLRLSEETSISKSKIFKAVDTRSLDQILSDFERRSLIRANLEKGYAGPSDPSL